MGRRVDDLAGRVLEAQRAADQRRLDAAYRERYGPTAVAPQIHPVRETVEPATLPTTAPSEHDHPNGA